MFSENSTVRAIADTMVPTTDIHVPMRSRRSATDLLEESSFTCSASLSLVEHSRIRLMAAMGDEVVGPVRKVIDDVGAVILAGGSGSRLGGNKALLPLAGAPMAQHVLDVVAGLVDRVVVVGNTMEEAKTVIAGLKWPDGVAAVPADDGVGGETGAFGGDKGGPCGVRPRQVPGGGLRHAVSVPWGARGPDRALAGA